MNKDTILKIIIVILIIVTIGVGVYFIFFDKEEVITTIKLNKNKISMYVGEKDQLSTTFANNDLIWESDNPVIATVSEDGLVTGNNEGTTLVVVTSKNGQYNDICFIEIKDKTKEIITLDKTSIELKVGENTKLSATITPEEYKNNKLTWTSDDSTIAIVDANGLVTGVKEGEVFVKAKGTSTETECLVKITDSYLTPPNKEDPKLQEYTVNFNANSGSVSLTKKEVIEKEEIGKLPTPTRSGYKFLGWYTSKSGGSKILETTKVTSNMTIYAHWEKIIVVMTDTYKIPSGYTDAGSYNSTTLKYKKMKKNNEHNYYTLVWVADAYHQLNSGNNSFNSATRKNLLNAEITNYNYQNKGMTAVNGSFSISGMSNTPVIISKGLLRVNEKYNINYVYGTLTIGSGGWLKNKKLSSVDEANTWLTSVGARNTWAITHFETSNWNAGTDGGTNFRTSICQIDENNFVLYVGYSKGIHDYMKELHDLFGCKIAVNLDGGGSSGIYDKKSGATTISEFYEYPHDRSRTVSDVLYFVEQ